MTTFLNPFHFVPLGKNVDGLKLDEFHKLVSGDGGAATSHLRHDRYVSGTTGTESFSGRLVCSLTAVGPFVVGGSGAGQRKEEDGSGTGQREEKDGSGIVPPFQINNAPAIPASSLRGLISSLAEALSNSTLRVLDCESYTVRLKWPRRGRHFAGWTHDYFSNVNADLVPFDAAPDKRTQITVAEQLFGFIAENAVAATRQGDADQPPESVSPIRGLASRLRFSDARLSQSLSSHDSTGGHYQAQVRLKILSSPKAPCPVLYFCRNQGGGVSKLDMTTEDRRDIRPIREDRRDIRPMGRKFYLHHPKHELLKTTNPPWQSSTTENNNQKVWVTPVKPGAAFVFHVDFNNLTETELGLLCRSLQPSDGFHHKLGMGKPLGLGTVKIQPLGLFLIDRKKRYESDDVFSATAPRYHSRANFTQQEWETAKAMYPTEAADEIPVDGASFQTRCDAFTPDPVIANAVRLLGTVPVTETADGKISYPQISYPLVNEATRAAEQEQKHYEWFVANDANNPQSLKPIDHQATELPVLDRLPRPRIH